MTELGPHPNGTMGVGINRSGQIATSSGEWDNLALYTLSLLYDNSHITAISANDAGRTTFATALKNLGTGIGTSDTGVWMWSKGVTTGIAGQNGEYSIGPKAINDKNQMVGSCRPAKVQFPSAHAFLYQDGKMTDLSQLPGVAGLGWQLVEAYGINNKGQIVGYGTTAATGTQMRAFLLTPSK